MRRRSVLACFALALAVVFAGAVAVAAGDTIVLKNGRRIVALSVVEEGEKVRYLTPAGELTLPKSIVDHIERGGAVMPDAPAGKAAGLVITPPAIEAGGAAASIESDVVHDGAVDRGFLARVEREARSGEVDANRNAAMAYHAAAQFELSRGDMEHALRDERTALTYAPEEPLQLLNVAYLHLRQSEYKQALDYLERARRVAPLSPDVAKLLGWAYYGMNKLEQAVAEWQRALKLRPDAEVQSALEKAQRDQQEEENYKENESAHFTLRYSGGAEPALAREILRALEVHFSAIESELGYTPPEPIGVILYTRQAFADITRAPAWVGALNDGRLRVPVQGLTELTPDLSRVLKHELTHSFVRQKTRGRAPTWIQEGLAQWMEGQRSGEHAASLVRVYDEKHGISLGELEGSWMRMPSDTAGYAYAWALANVEYIVQSDGMVDLERILDRIAAEEPTDAAVREVLHTDYDELMHSTAEYLRRTYSH
jgi:tetratricopeptide (TPR) repeat protein